MGKTCYLIGRDYYYFNNLKFIELVQEQYPAIKEQTKITCQLIADDLRNEYSKYHNGELDCAEEDVPGLYGIYGWYLKDKKNGLYTSPRNITIVETLAKLLNIDMSTLLTKSHNIEIEEISAKEPADISDPLEILIYVIMDYAKSTAYNYIPGTDNDGLEYYNRLLDKAKKNAIATSCTSSKMQLIESIYTFVNSYEGYDAINDFLISYNPRLAFFCSPFEIMEESIEGAFNLYRRGIQMKFIPTLEQVYERKKYLDIHGDIDRDALFMKELAETTRRIYCN